MINPPLIPAWIISVTWIVSGLLCVYNILMITKYNHLTLSFASRGLLAGLLIFAPASIFFGVLYYYYTIEIVDVAVRAIWIRYGILYLAIAFGMWQFVIIWLRGKNG